MIIYKYRLNPRTDLRLPVQSKVLTVHVQGEDICLWVKIPTGNDHPPVERGLFKTFPTGMEFKNERLDYIGTSFMENGLVFHTFEQKDVVK